MKTITVGPCHSLGLTLKFSNKASGGVITAIHPSCPFRHDVEVGDRLTAVNGTTIFCAEHVRVGSGETRVLSITPRLPAVASGGESNDEDGNGVPGDEGSEGEASGPEDEEDEDGGPSKKRRRRIAPLAIEPCSIRRLKNHLSVLENELQEYIRTKSAEIEHTKERIAYLRTDPDGKIEYSESASKRKYSRKQCSVEGCNHGVVNSGVCLQHGAKKRVCKHEGCTKTPQNGGVCYTHGAKIKYCSVEGCTTQARSGGICRAHGAKMKLCYLDGCSNIATNNGVCCRHGAKVRMCSRNGCPNQAQKGGLCWRHGAKELKQKRNMNQYEEWKHSMGEGLL